MTHVTPTTGSQMLDQGDRVLARERERFLSDGALPARVRPEISSSWRRCSSWSVSPEHIEPPYRPDVDPESRLLRAAAPVLDALGERLSELDISFILTDEDARILDRRVEHRALLHAFDDVHVTPGFVFAEDAVGTNGLGTAIELGRTVRVDGHEHYTTDLVRFTCVGVPIVDPIRRRPLGILDVTCPADHENALVTVIAEQAAREIQTRLVEEQSVLERALLGRFLAASRRSHGGVVVLGDRVLLSDPQAARLLDGVDQPLVWERAARAMAGDGVLEQELPLPDGRAARTRTVAVRDGGAVIGALMEIRADEAAARPARAAVPDRPPGLAGTDRAFLDAYRIARATPRDRVLAICGEAGAGKLALAEAVARARGGRPVTVCDAAAAEVDGEPGWLACLRHTLTEAPGELVLRHVDLLSPGARRSLAAQLRAATSRGWRCTATLTAGAHWQGPALPEVDTEQVVVPPLRDRLQDVPALVAAFAAPARVAPEVVQLLMRLSWPGNLRELRSVVRRTLDAAPADGPARLAHVPADVRRAAPRRPLTRFERAEVHVILTALAETGGNKKDAAALLGISRSTLYRKLQAAGVDLENTVY